jgi:hypothetical protein
LALWVNDETALRQCSGAPLKEEAGEVPTRTEPVSLGFDPLARPAAGSLLSPQSRGLRFDLSIMLPYDCFLLISIRHVSSSLNFSARNLVSD